MLWFWWWGFGKPFIEVPIIHPLRATIAIRATAAVVT